MEFYLWLQQNMQLLAPWIMKGLKIILMVVVAMWLRWLVDHFFKRISDHGPLPIALAVPLNSIAQWIIFFTVALLILGQLGVSAEIIWTALTGFVAVGAIAFFAAWSVLSNIFCTILIFFTRPFSVGDEIELLDATDKNGIRGRVEEIHMLYTVLQEIGREDGRPTLVQIPNSAFFQKTLRRWPAQR